MRELRPHGVTGVRSAARLASLRLGAAREAEIVEELSQHLDDRYEQLRAEAPRRKTHGGSRSRSSTARMRWRDGWARCGRRAFRRRCRTDRRAAASSADVLHDLRYAARMLRKQPGFTIAAVLTLALGIGANTAVFSLVNATLFQRLPVPDRERLVYVNRGTGGVFSYPQYEALRDHAPSFEALAGWGGITASLHAGDSAELVSGFIVTGNFFEVLGIQPARGRLLSRATTRRRARIRWRSSATSSGRHVSAASRTSSAARYASTATCSPSSASRRPDSPGRRSAARGRSTCR